MSIPSAGRQTIARPACVTATATKAYERGIAARRASGRAYLLLTLTALCWGANAIFGRLAVGEISPMALVSLRWLGALGLLVVFAHAQVRRDWPAIRERLPFVAAMGAIGFTVFNALFYVAAHWTTAVNIGIIQGSVPVFVLIGALAAYRTPGRRAAGRRRARDHAGRRDRRRGRRPRAPRQPRAQLRRRPDDRRLRASMPATPWA